MIKLFVHAFHSCHLHCPDPSDRRWISGFTPAVSVWYGCPQHLFYLKLDVTSNFQSGNSFDVIRYILSLDSIVYTFVQIEHGFIERNGFSVASWKCCMHIWYVYWNMWLDSSFFLKHQVIFRLADFQFWVCYIFVKVVYLSDEFCSPGVATYGHLMFVISSLTSHFESKLFGESIYRYVYEYVCVCVLFGIPTSQSFCGATSLFLQCAAYTIWNYISIYI